MRQYVDLLRHVLEGGREKGDRTGTGTTSLFGHQMRFNLKDGFPLLTTKKVHFKSVVHELLWFIAGDTNIKYLQDNGVRIWNEWANDNGDLGPVYGKQWRSWPELTEGTRTGYIDQLADAQRMLRENPDSRRIIVSSWNPADIPHMALPPCHCFFQFYSAEKPKKELASNLRLLQEERTGPMSVEQKLNFARKMMSMNLEDLQKVASSNGLLIRDLSCQLYQRSVDVFLGLPFNIASYALMTHMMAQVTDHDVGDFLHTSGDVHIYSNHMEQVDVQLAREPGDLPHVVLNPNVKNIFDFKYEDVALEGYNPAPAIKAKVAV